MAKPRMSYWIKMRMNPQIGTYYVPCGQLPAKDARAKENSLYGANHMLKFTTKKAYEAELARLRAAGEKVR